MMADFLKYTFINLHFSVKNKTFDENKYQSSISHKISYRNHGLYFIITVLPTKLYAAKDTESQIALM